MCTNEENIRVELSPTALPYPEIGERDRDYLCIIH